MTIERFTKSQAHKLLSDELGRVGWDGPSTFTVEEGARADTQNLSWWHKRTPENERADTQRNIAYLSAYHRIAEPLGGRMYAGGLLLDRRRLWMDRSVMSRLERDGYVVWNAQERGEPWFGITDAGRNLIKEHTGEAG